MSELWDLLDEYEQQMFEFSGVPFLIPSSATVSGQSRRLGEDVWIGVAERLGIEVADIPGEAIEYYRWCESRILDEAVNGNWSRQLLFPDWWYVPPTSLTAQFYPGAAFDVWHEKTEWRKAPFADTGTDDWRLNGQGLCLFHVNRPYVVLSTRPSDAGSLWLRDERHGKLFDSISEMVRFHIGLFDRGGYVLEPSPYEGGTPVVFWDAEATEYLLDEGNRLRRVRTIGGGDPAPDEDLWHLDDEATHYPNYL